MQTIRFGDDGLQATRDLVARLENAAPAWQPHVGPARLETLKAQLATLERIDRQYGGESPLALEGSHELVDSILTEFAHFYSDLRHTPNVGEDLPVLVLGVALWAIRHDVEITVVEPVVNALADRSNEARSTSELAAVLGLMQGVIAHVAPRLSADLERSNPDRPWRPLHLNLAITAIRTEDPDLMTFAFDALERALPDDCPGFFAEALARALSPRIKPAVRESIEARHRKWTVER